jgi:hypothetical protein
VAAKAENMATVPLPDTRASAISLVTAALRGDVDAVRFALDMCAVDEWVPMFHASLALLRGPPSTRLSRWAPTRQPRTPSICSGGSKQSLRAVVTPSIAAWVVASDVTN